MYQFKWSENHNLFKDSLDRFAKDGVEQIFGNARHDPEMGELLSNLSADLYECRALIQRVYIHYVFKGNSDSADKSDGLQYLKENVENKRYLLQSFFQNPDIDRLALSQAVQVETADGQQTMYVGFAPLMDLQRIYDSLRQRFLSRNIRYGLPPDNPPNAKIREALTDIVIKRKMSPDLFAFNHNGVTRAAERLAFENGHATIKVPRLLNGAQTITSVARFLEDNKGNPSLQNSDALEAIKVLTRIVVDDPFSDFVTNVTMCNNRQNPVEPWNLRANDKIQCELSDKFRDQEHGIFYSRQENAMRSFSAEELDEMGIEDSHEIRIRPLAQTFLAVQGEIARISQLPEVFEKENQYQDCFKKSYLESDCRKIVIAYKVQLVLRSPMLHLQEITSQKLAYTVSRAKNLVWALLIQGILNDPKLAILLEDYGIHLSRESGFRDYLKKLASTRILPILKEVLGQENYKRRIDEEKYDFLRTKEIFKVCMESAYDRFGWTKKSV